jgi:tRNA pseudouridine13 synthase
MFHFQPEEFIVEEILENGEILEVDRPFKKQDEPLKNSNHFFSHFILQKRLWTTNNAIRNIADRLHINSSRMNFAGNKDRNALTTQLCSAFAISPAQMTSFNLRDIRILGAWVANEKITIGDLAGNRFTIILNETNVGKTEFKKITKKKIEAKLKKANFAIPNYFGEQRFGSARKNTAAVGKYLIQGKFKEAILNYLCYTDEGEHDEWASAARKQLEKEMNFQTALHYFPHFLKIERTLLGHLSRLPNDYLGAFRQLHRSLQLLFIHAYQSELFNKILDQKLESKNGIFKPGIGEHYCLLNELGFPENEKVMKINEKKDLATVKKLIADKKAVLVGNLVGFMSELTKEEEKALKKEGLKKEDFNLRITPELRSKGAFRPLFVFLKDFEIDESGSGMDRKIRLKFSLPSGSYATTVLKEILN